MESPSDFHIDYRQDDVTYNDKQIAIAKGFGIASKHHEYEFVGTVRIATGDEHTFESMSEIEVPERVTKRTVKVHQVKYAAMYAVKVRSRVEPLTIEDLRK